MNSDASDPSLIGIDWGTSSLRAYLMDARGEVLDRLKSPASIMKVPDKKFEDICQRTLDPWLTKKILPIIASGMITSRHGWLETPYQALPAGAEQLASALVPLRTKNELLVHFVTGVSTDRSGSPDVIRGEETQILGAIDTGITNGTFVMPGTHSKWVTVRDGRIEDFATFMSGEIFEALSRHTILGTLMKDGGFCKTQFREGVRKGLEAGPSLLHSLFQVRTLPLFGMMGEEAVGDFLSGMLIGSEIGGATLNHETTDSVIIIGRDDLADRYAIALNVAGQTNRRAANDIVARGHFAIATSAGLLP